MKKARNDEDHKAFLEILEVRSTAEMLFQAGRSWTQGGSQAKSKTVGFFMRSPLVLARHKEGKKVDV